MPTSAIVDATQAQKWVAKTYLCSLQICQPNSRLFYAAAGNSSTMQTFKNSDDLWDVIL
jgi:hypothetical protein